MLRVLHHLHTHFTTRATPVSAPRSDLHVEYDLGSGHYGSVRCVRWRYAETEEDRRGFALKIVKHTQLKTKSKRRALRERVVMSELTSPFHVHLINAFISKTHLFMLMELAPGNALNRFVQRKYGLTLGGGAGNNYDQAGAIMFYTANIVLAVQHLHKVRACMYVYVRMRVHTCGPLTHVPLPVK